MKSTFNLFGLILFWLFVNGLGFEWKNCPSKGIKPVPPTLAVTTYPYLTKDQKSLACHAPYPIQIVFDASEQSTLSYGWYTVSYSNFLNPSTYNFFANKVVTFQNHTKVETIVCVSVDSPCLQQRLQVSNTSERGDQLRFDLEEMTTKGPSLPDSQSVVVNTSDTCDAFFYYEESDDKFQYKFRCKFADGTPGQIKQFGCANSMSCIHILRRHTLQRGCWSRFNSSTLAKCDGCQARTYLDNFLSSVTICVKDGQKSKIGTLVYYGVASKDFPRPKISFSMDDLKGKESESSPFINIVEFETVQDLNSTLLVECRASSFATAASIQWALEFKDQSQFNYLAVDETVKWVEAGNYRSQKLVLQLNDTALIKVHCYASIENTYKWLHASRSIQVQAQDNAEMKSKQHSDSVVRMNIIITVSVVIPVLIIIAIFVVVLFWRIKRLKNALRSLTEEEIRDFKYGTGLLDPNDAHSSIHGRPFDPALEISKEFLELDEKCILGSGQYGIVMKGYILDGSKVDSSTGKKELVAIKTVKSDVDVDNFKALLSEIKIMGFLEKHENIVGLIGACTANIKEREVWAAIEFCGNGDLLGYLKKHRRIFKNLFESNSSPSTIGNEYENMTLTTLDLFKFAKEIANGMNYLTIKNVIHGDLAARNVLITDKMGVKISDFGLSRQLLQYSNYVKTQQVPLPFRWLAIESLKDMEFSIKSDVWSFGVVLWEIFSLGETPYPGYSWTHEFLDQLTSGYRMKRPDFANGPIIMLDCWRLQPDTRPSFDSIYSQIVQIQISSSIDPTTNTQANAKC